MPSLGLNRLSSPRHAAAPTIAKPPVYDRAVELTKYYRSVLPSIEFLWDDEEGNINPRESQQQRTPRRPKSPCALPLTRADTDSKLGRFSQCSPRAGVRPNSQATLLYRTTTNLRAETSSQPAEDHPNNVDASWRPRTNSRLGTGLRACGVPLLCPAFPKFHGNSMF
jgi:hypothetical protein